jgi:hypothetical protein
MDQRQRQRGITCYGHVPGSGWTQEHYETKSRDAGRRARFLRRQGYRVIVDWLGPQVTGVGIKMTMLHVVGNPLPPAKVEKI